MMAICTRCGQENRAAARFCSFCGQILADEFIDNALIEEPVVEQPIETLSDAAAGIKAGQILVDRYRIIQQLSSEDNCAIYSAEDLLRCWNCLAEQPTTSVDYCESCGVELNRKPSVHLKACSTEEADSPPDDPLAFFDQGTFFEVELPVSEKSPSLPSVLRQVSAYQNHPGLVRDNNEDSLIALSLSGRCEPDCLATLGLFAIADGVGGADSGEIASKTAITTLAREVIQCIFIPELAGQALDSSTLSHSLAELAQSANQAILDLRSQQVDSEMGCTLTAALLRNNHATVINIGDSRTYHLRQGKLIQITQDHSMIAQLVEQGFIQPEDIPAHLQRNVIYRSLGNQPETPVDVFDFATEAGDKILLCSDGLWEKIPDSMLEEVLLDRSDPQHACDRLIELANLAGGDDNISVIVVSLSS